jgi:dipeptidyl aminopeptidase/acylaminoacyl peptidase
MNGTDRLERELTTWFADTAAPQTPDWTADILAATSTMRQRPRWSFPTRWLPAAVVPRLAGLPLRPVPWRTIALLAVLVLLLAAAVALYVGSRPRLPAPFGPAANGLVAYGELGEIWTVDPVTGARQKIVTLTGGNEAPRFSRDGTRLAFLRRAEGGQSLAITNSDGSHLVVSKAPFVEADTDSIAWSPDGQFVAVVANRGLLRTTYLVDSTTGEVRDLNTPYVDTEAYWRPPDGRQLMYMRSFASGEKQPTLVTLVDGRINEFPLGDPQLEARPGGWTPDGEYFVVHRYDGQHARTDLLDPETGKTIRREVGFGRASNDGKLLVGRMTPGGSDPALCVMPVSGGSACRRIADPRFTPDFDHTAGLQWSPDDRWIVVYPQDERGWVLLDPEGGPAITPVWSERGVESWQRLAP